MRARKKYWFKCMAVFAILNLLAEVFYPTVAFALTAGPSQPEMQGFEPVGTSNMVDLASGSFTYNIPLMDVEGYPINLSYHSGITMDEEASWVGLGWNINPGEINRQMRGLPDEFQGDQVIQNFNMKDDITAGVTIGANLKTFGIPIPANASLGIYNNNYRGTGITMGLNFDPSLLSTLPNKGVLTSKLGVQYNSQSGIDIDQNIGFANEEFNTAWASINLGGNIGATYNSRSGIKELSMGADIGISGPNYINANMRVSGDISFCNRCYTPTISMPLMNNSISAEFGAGLAIFGINPNITLQGFFSQITLATHTMVLPGYGYMYASQGKDNPYALHDFNREKDVPFFKNIANLPITNFTYDLYSVNGQGVSGQFRPFRGDVGVLFDHECYNQSTSTSLSLELGLTEVSHTGGTLGSINSNTVTDKWTRDNNFVSNVDFHCLQPGNTNYEPFYFKEVGQKTVNDVGYYARINDTHPMDVHLLQFGTDVFAEDVFNVLNTTAGVSGNLTRTQREKRNQCMSILNAQEAAYFGLDKDILSYPLNTNVYSKNCDSLNLIKHYSRRANPPWHPSEITVLNPDGKRYVYGIPAYNLLQDEATFSVGGSTTPSYQSDSVNLIHYGSGSDNTIGNTQGRDNYFKEEILPPYAHSYLLTGVLSPDYVDMTGDGITDDDLGEAVKLNYTCLYNRNNPYKWRVPFEKDYATYQMGLLTDDMDDKGNYIYGKKEVWYVHSIESKTMVAQFILEDRADAFGVIDSNGGGDFSKPLKRLKEIRLYSKADLIKNGSHAIPVKTVHFKYEYTLCQKTPNSNSSTNAKLTLTEVYFTYQNNTEGSLNSYKFSYSGFNPSYSHNRYDRWGFYKYNSSGMPSNQDYPYSIQDSVEADLFAQAWNLTGIDLPSGGHIEVKYESNDYAYVQNKRAAEMFTVEGMLHDSTGTTSSLLYSGPGIFNNWIDFYIPVAELSRGGFYKDYLEGIDEGGSKLYFRFLVDVDGNNHYEYVPGYADIADYRKTSSDGHHWAIQIKQVVTGDLSVFSANPITLSAWQFVRLNLPQYAYPGSSTSGGALGIIEGLIGIADDVSTIANGFDGYVESEGFGKYIFPSHSYIRLDNPNYKKYGGGTRVKEIDISDNWATMVYNQQSSFTYGQTYDYTTTKGNQIISSGVATYEPLIGGDENPCRQPLPYAENYLCAPNNEFYTETPLGESLYPAPGVVYSKVTVTDLKHPGVSRTSTGYTVNQFYTANDFPVINKWTYLDGHPIKPSIILSLFNTNSNEYMTATQGFTVETNDMPGKEKSQQIYDADSSLISSVSYIYKVDDPNSPLLQLNNDVHVVNPDGSINIASVGKDIDTWEDMREQETISGSSDVSLNNEFFIFPLLAVPIDIPIGIPITSTEDVRFRSAVTTKYIHRTGLLDKVIKTLNGSSVTTKNMLYDAETGEVLLKQTKNEFDEPVYNFTYPAHWAYDGMGPAYKNIDAVFSGVNITSGSLPSSVIPSVTSGDELSYISPTFGLTDTLLWVTQPLPGGPLSVVDKNDSLANLTNVTLKVIRSGRRNMASIPVGTLVSMVPPMCPTNMLEPTSSFDILQATATTYNDIWKVPTNDVQTLQCTSSSGPSYTCLRNFMDSILVHHQIWAAPSDNILFGKYCPACGYSNYLYYALTPPVGVDGITNFYAQLGDCEINITTQLSGGAPVHMDTPGLSVNPPDFEETKSTCIVIYNYEEHLVEATVCKSCDTCQNVCVDLNMGKPFNPYTVGMLGNWRPERNYVYYDLRSPTLTASQSNIWESGTSMDFSSIWQVPANGSMVWPLNTSDPNWTWSDQMMMYDQKGNEIENKDALLNYSTALYGYLQSLPVAVASNSKYKEIACDGFEDYGFTTNCSNPCNNNHWDFSSLVGHNIYVDTTSALSHTGRYSLKVHANKAAAVARSISYNNDSLYYATATQYYLRPGGNIPLFAPDSGKYLLSAWVSENINCPVGYTGDSIVVRFAGSTNKYIIHPSGPVIEGWQQMGGNFFVPGSADTITVILVAGNSTAYFDDIRIQPFAAEMKTYVYDPISMRLMATLDENNYATFYEYNDEGILMRVKKETERGIMTIKETRASYPRI